MSKTVTFRCDCGCRAKADKFNCEGWLKLRQKKYGDGEGGVEPKLENTLHFKSFECLTKWLRKANEVIPDLQNTALGVSPRGSFSSKNVYGLSV